MGYLTTELDEIRAFLEESGLHNWSVDYEGPWRDYDAYVIYPRTNSTEFDREMYVLEHYLSMKPRFRIFEGHIPCFPILSDDTSIEELVINQMFCNSHFVDYIDSVGKKQFKDWSIHAYMCGKMGPGDYHPELDLTAIKYSEINGLIMNGTDGVHYGYELFLKPQRTWPLRGAPYFWCEMARELTDHVLPLSDDIIDAAVRRIREKHGIPDSGEEWVLVPEYCADVHSGMSSGAVFPDGINEMVDEIKQRNALYTESPRSFVERYVMRFEMFPYLKG